MAGAHARASTLSFAEYHDLTLGDLLEGIVLHAFEGKAPFGPASMNDIAKCRKCGSPILGNEWLCSNCGERVADAPPQPAPNAPPPSSSGVKVVLWALAGIVVLEPRKHDSRG